MFHLPSDYCLVIKKIYRTWNKQLRSKMVDWNNVMKMGFYASLLAGCIIFIVVCAMFAGFTTVLIILLVFLILTSIGGAYIFESNDKNYILIFLVIYIVLFALFAYFSGVIWSIGAPIVAVVLCGIVVFYKWPTTTLPLT